MNAFTVHVWIFLVSFGADFIIARPNSDTRSDTIPLRTEGSTLSRMKLAVCVIGDYIHVCENLFKSSSTVDWECVERVNWVDSLATGQCDVALDLPGQQKQYNRTDVQTIAVSPRNYALAVVKQTSSITNFSQLEGKRSYHNGGGDFHTWVAPVAELLKRGMVNEYNHDNLVPNSVEVVLETFESACQADSGPLRDAFLGGSGCPKVVAANPRQMDPKLALLRDADEALGYLGDTVDVAFVTSRSLDESLLRDPEAIGDLSLLCGSTRANMTWLPLVNDGTGFDATYTACNLGSTPPDVSLFARRRDTRSRMWIIRRAVQSLLNDNEKSGSGFPFSLSPMISGSDDGVTVVDEEHEDAIGRVEALDSVPYSIGISQRLRRHCSLPVCKEIFRLQDERSRAVR